MRTLIIATVLIYSSLPHSLAADKDSFLNGKIVSPYDACKDKIIVSEENYKENKRKWDEFEKNCKTKILVSMDAGFTSIDPLKEGIQYLDFSQRVAKKVIENLEKSRSYAECSAKCFSGASTCEAKLSDTKKAVQCSDRKKEVKDAMKVFSTRIRMELALSNDAPGFSNVNIRTVLSSDKDKFVNTNLRDFEIGTPNPVGRSDLTEREMKEALRRVDRDRKKLEDEYKNKGYKNYSDWMSVKLMEKFDEHRANYRSLIYENAPIFSVIEKPVKFENGSEPVWSDNQMASAFKKLSENSTLTQKKVKKSLDAGKLEFKRINGEAFANWMKNIAPGTTEQNDLLFYLGMKNQVEEVLKNDPSLCGIATTMNSRLHSKELQNTGLTFTATLGGSVAVRGASGVGASILRIGRALTGAEAAGLTGMSLGASFLGDSFRQYRSAETEAATLSGLDKEKEGTALIKAEKITEARDGLKMNLVFAPIDAGSGWALGKTLYSSLSKQMAKDLPQISSLAKKAEINESARDQLVDTWLIEKVKSALKSNVITSAEKAALESKGSSAVLQSLSSRIEKSNPDFFKNPKNMDFFIKTAATTIKKEKGDPTDLGQKAESLLLKLNAETLNGSWDPAAQNGLLKVFNNVIEELRLTAKDDPATYAKFTVDPESQQKVLLGALKKSGIKSEKDGKSMLQCALP